MFSAVKIIFKMRRYKLVKADGQTMEKYQQEREKLHSTIIMTIDNTLNVAIIFMNRGTKS